MLPTYDLDTDSLYIDIGQYLSDKGIREKFDTLDQKVQLEFIKRICDTLNGYVNLQSLEQTQRKHYNSNVEDFRIIFEPEKIALTGLFTSKKRYATWTLLDDGKWKNAMSITGLEVIRSDSPECVKPMIIQILEMILKKHPDDEIRDTIHTFKEELHSASPEMIAENKGINQIDKYLLPNYEWRSKTPHQLKGVANFRFFLNKFGLEDRYDSPMEGMKAKIVYLKPNRFNKTSLSFYKWPKEFDKLGIEVDYEKMIFKNFTKKISGLLVAINKLGLLEKQTLLDMLF